MLTVLEHRYYGESQPFPDWSIDNLKWLSSKQALADMADFIKFTNAWVKTAFGGDDRKWVVVGGSYPGAMAAWFKALYPDLAIASWSSSGVVNAI